MRLRLADPERLTLAEIAKRLGRKALKDVAQGAKPDTILAWYRRLIAQKSDGSCHRGYPGRPRVCSEIEALVRMARENRTSGYDRIVGALSNLGHRIYRLDCGQHFASIPDRTSAGAESHDHLEGVHPVAHGRARLAQTSSRSKC
jgi:hypothetical protein